MSLTHLHFDETDNFCVFDHPLDHLPSITFLTLDENYNKPLDNLPSSVTHIRIGPQYAQSLDKRPPSVKYVQLLTYSSNPCYDSVGSPVETDYPSITIGMWVNFHMKDPRDPFKGQDRLIGT